MASIQTGIQLADNFTAPLMHIISSVNMAVTQMETLNNAMNADIDTATLEGIHNELNQASIAATNLSSELSQVNVPATSASTAVSQIGDEIQQNIQQQQQFNQAVQGGASGMDGLVGKVMRLAAAYATMEAAKKVVGASDDLVQLKSRLNLMNDGVQSTDELLNIVYASAQDARGSLNGMADVVARFGNNAKDAFSSSAEVVAFANLIQKQMTVAGASTSEASAAMLQLSQALGSGVLRGDELNSIFEQAPNLIQNIADYLDVPIGQIREMASEGQLTADIVKNSIFAATDEINANFQSMPMTWGQVWTSFENSAIMAFQPVLNKINELANSSDFQAFADNAVNTMATVAGVVMEVFDLMLQTGSFVADNWGTIAPIIGAVVSVWVAYNSALAIYNGIQAISNTLAAISAARSVIKSGATLGEAAATTTATGAQVGFNAALLACPLTWIILLIVALIAVLIAVANEFSGAGHTAQTAFGVITGGVNVVIQFFKNLGLTVANIALGIWEALNACASNSQTAFQNAILSIQSWFYDLMSTALCVIESICVALNKLPFVEFDYSGISSAADDYAAKSAEAANSKGEYTSVVDAFNSGASTFDVYKNGWVSDAYNAGAKWGDNVSNQISDTLSGLSVDMPDVGEYSAQIAAIQQNAANTAASSADTAKNTAKVANTLSATSEDLKYIRDMAEQNYINRFTTASITVNQTNNNTINNDMDLDGVTEHLRNTMEEQMIATAEGVH